MIIIASARLIAAPASPIYPFPVIPDKIYPTLAQSATVNAYGICVATWSMCLHCAPADERIVVSEIGEI